ncbi:9142_t:CDS:10 [Racocetra fulgida]|uniref:9142_t:CDS:1 n=1 Tax=Racocetra fulgida TaxID=60492 RepID=A0A9N8VL74_9GLOM|nr:9142_t:CDS:10 [Racocetra fulgida]
MINLTMIIEYNYLLFLEAVEYIINHSEVPIVVAGANHIPELIRIAPKIPVMKVIISMDEFDDGAAAPAPIDSVSTGKILKAWARDNGILLLDFNEVEKLGQQHPRRHNPPSPSDLAFICYTSGTTGTPKGAMLTHSNCIGARNGFDLSWRVFPNDLAHVLELGAEMLMISGGASIGYFRGDVLNLIDDIAELKPTIFPSVPRLLTRVHAKLQQNTVYAPGIKGALSRKAIAAKLQNLEDGKGYTHAFWDRIIFNKIKQVLGGRVRVILTGSAPIGPEILQFLRVAFACDIAEDFFLNLSFILGYGQTEGVAAATITLEGENKVGHVGDVPEMNYYSTDKPYPRGELCYRGPNIFVGYYKDNAKTKETIDSEGWLHSGDVAYLENEYVNSNLILQIFVHGDSLRNYLVAVVVPDPETFVPWANALTNQNVSLGDEKGLEILVNDKTVKSAFLEHMNEIAKQSKLKGFETVKAIHLSGVPFSIENNLLTPTQNKYGEEIARLRVAEGYVNRAFDQRKNLREAVIKDLESLHTVVTSNLSRAVKDNDIIYLNTIPSASSLPQIGRASLASPALPPEVNDPISLMNERSILGLPLFVKLVPFAVHQAHSVYSDRKERLVKEEILFKLNELTNDQIIPQLILANSQDVRNEGGVTRLNAMFDSIQDASPNNNQILDEALNILDQEAMEDEEWEKKFGERWTRKKSTVANKDLIDQGLNYQQILQQALKGDLAVKNKLEQWSQHIESLGSDRVTHANIGERNKNIEEIKKVSNLDDIGPKLLKEAAKITANGTAIKIEPAHFEELFIEELKKYDKYLELVQSETENQEKLLSNIEVNKNS